MENKFGAFTLAEVLITLTIIGVIAALTIPNLMQRYQEQTTVNKVKKFYSTLSNIYSQVTREYGNFDEWGMTNSDEATAKKVYDMVIKPYFKVDKDCGTNNKGDCFPNIKYKLLNNKLTANFANNTNSGNQIFYKIVLKDGSALAITGGGKNSVNNKAIIAIDINGTKNPNIVGKDLFFFDFNQSGFYPQDLQSIIKANKSCIPEGWGCSGWVIYKGNMDYLHCSDLSWNGKNKCR